MKNSFNNEFSVPLGDSVTFARLSGDYNPLHIDPIAARRVRFGSTVVHGIHVFLRALDELAANELLDRREPAALSVAFQNPVLSGTIVHVNASAQGDKIRLSGECAGQSAFTGEIELRSAYGGGPVIDDAEFPHEVPHDVDFPPIAAGDNVPLQLCKALLAQLFPSLVKLPGISWIADLLATTRIVGMRCPGMHSIYSSFRLRRVMGSAELAHTMRYRVDGVEKRFKLLRIQVEGASLSGVVEAFFRPRPIAQRPFREIVAAVAPNAFLGHRALVVGGSRGLGELTAKIVAAGGGDVTITYSRGQEDAARVCAEVQDLGFSCTARQMDVVADNLQHQGDWLTAGFSHVYFFASPFISRNVERWSDELFHDFTRTYVSAFAALVRHILAARDDKNRRVRFFYPSSIFVTHPEAGFAEYAVAKAAGEALCDQLSIQSGALFTKTRLPRMRTDQTSALAEKDTTDSFPIMLEVVHGLHL